MGEALIGDFMFLEVTTGSDWTALRLIRAHRVWNEWTDCGESSCRGNFYNHVIETHSCNYNPATALTVSEGDWVCHYWAQNDFIRHSGQITLTLKGDCGSWCCFFSSLHTMSLSVSIAAHHIMFQGLKAASLLGGVIHIQPASLLWFQEECSLTLPRFGTCLHMWSLMHAALLSEALHLFHDTAFLSDTQSGCSKGGLKWSEGSERDSHMRRIKSVALDYLGDWIFRVYLQVRRMIEVLCLVKEKLALFHSQTFGESNGNFLSCKSSGAMKILISVGLNKKLSSRFYLTQFSAEAPEVAHRI